MLFIIQIFYLLLVPNNFNLNEDVLIKKYFLNFLCVLIFYIDLIIIYKKITCLDKIFKNKSLIIYKLFTFTLGLMILIFLSLLQLKN